MKNISTILIFIFSLSAFAIDEKKDLFLVVGSVRADDTGGGPVYSAIHNGDDLDCSHQKTWNSKATTFDLNPCKNLCGPHIVGDGVTFDFSAYTIKKVYLERLFTQVDGLADAGNLIGAILKNIKPHMESGATLEIELDPCLQFGAYTFWQTESDLEQLRKQNPFHGFHHYVMTYDAAIELVEENFDEAHVRKELLKNDFYTEEMVQIVFEKRRQLLRWIDKLAEITSIAPEILARRVVQEMTIYHQLKCLSQKYPNCLMGYSPLVSLLPGGTTVDCNEFVTSFDNAAFILAPRNEIGNILSLVDQRPDKMGSLRNFNFFTLNQFFIHSLSNMLFSFIAVEQNQEYIVNYLTNLGFVDVVVELGDSPYNFRKNFWFVRAVKP